MFENVDGRTDRRRTTDARVTGILIAHLGAFGSGELITEYGLKLFQSYFNFFCAQASMYEYFYKGEGQTLPID